MGNAPGGCEMWSYWVARGLTWAIFAYTNENKIVSAQVPEHEYEEATILMARIIEVVAGMSESERESILRHHNDTNKIVHDLLGVERPGPYLSSAEWLEAFAKVWVERQEGGE